jgi:CHAT domain-containing protein/Tfp pilus assembly protein PilF
LLLLPWLLGANGTTAVETPLEAGPSTAARLAAGEAQTYRIARHEATLRVVVDEDGRDLVVELIPPSGASLVVASPGNRYGIDSIVFHPQEPTDYRLVVRAAGEAPREAGYRIRLEVPGPDGGPARLRAEELTTEALRQWTAETPEARKAALDLFLQAGPLWAEDGNGPEQVMSLLSAAVLHRLAGASGKALDAANRALAVERPLGDPRIEAVLLVEAGWAQASLGHLEPARELYNQALDRLKTAADPYTEGTALNDLGLTYHNQNDLRTARGFYERALPLLQQTGDLRTEAAVTSNIGGIYQQLGEPSLALALDQRAADIQGRLGGETERDQARTLGNMGAIQLEIGLYQQALNLFTRSRETAHRLEDREAEARALSGIGLVQRALGDLPGAVESLQASLALRRQTQDRRGEAATLVNLGRTAIDRGAPQEAVADFESALKLQRSLGDPRSEATALQALSEAHQALGQTDQALDLITRSVAALRALDARRPLCAALRQQSEILTVRPGSAEPGAAAAREALGFCRATQDQPGEAQALLALAKAERSLGQLPAAEGHAEEALGAVESMRAGIASPDLRASFLSRLQDAYGLAIDLLMQRHRLEPAAGFDRQALAMAERARARGLLDLLREAGTDVRQGIDPSLLERRARLEERLTAKSRHHLDLLDRPPGDPERAATEKELQEILAGLETVDGEIRTRSPRYAALTRPHPLDAAGIQALLDPTTLLLVYRLGEPKSFLWAVSPSAVTSFELPPKREIEDAARAVYGRWKVRDLAARREDEATAAHLSAMILGPAAGLLREQRLAVVADGALEYLPFAALPSRSSLSSDTEPLIVHHEVVSLPSVSVLGLLRQEAAGRPAPPDRIAVVADPVFRADDPRLPAATRDPAPDAAFDRLVWSRTEAEAIARIAAPRPALLDLDFDANLEAVTGGTLRGYRIVHLATHGVLDSEHPALSGLVLSLVDRQGKPRPGLLRLGDIYNLSLDADLVVLSGCQTALGKQVRGEGLVGLTRGFLYAGADRVMSSLWRVQDRATAELMTRFYRALLTSHLPPPAALRSAQLSMLHDRRWSLPYDWAGFAVYGDWR